MSKALRLGPSLSGYTGEFDADARELQELRRLVHERFGEELTEHRIESFTDRELRTSPLLSLEVALEPLDNSADEGTTWDFSGSCEICAAGARQTSPLRVTPSSIRTSGSVFHMGGGETALAEDLALELLAAKLDGFELGHVYAATDGRRLPWLQLSIATTLPPLSAETMLQRSEVCESCRRSGWFPPQNAALTLTYAAADVDLNELPDMSLTWELWGYSRTMARKLSHRDADPDSLRTSAPPMIVCKPAVYAFARTKRLRNLRFRPVRLI